MYKFIKTRDLDNHYDNTDVEIVVYDGVNRQDLIEEFLHFLKACGFNTDDLDEELMS